MLTGRQREDQFQLDLRFDRVRKEMQKIKAECDLMIKSKQLIFEESVLKNQEK